jgi:hypothetical protein
MAGGGWRRKKNLEQMVERMTGEQCQELENRRWHRRRTYYMMERWKIEVDEKEWRRRGRRERGWMTEKRIEGREEEWRRRGWRGERMNGGEEDGGERG